MNQDPQANVQRLSDVMARGAVSAILVLRYASQLSQELLRIHQGGRTHGAVNAANIFIREGQASLGTPAAAPVNRSAADDSLEFGLVFRGLLAAADSHLVERAPAPEILSQLEKVGATYLPAKSMTRVAVALKLLRMKFREEAIPQDSVPGQASQTGIPAARPRRKVVMLIRAVPPGGDSEPQTSRRLPASWKWWFVLPLIVGLAIGALFVFLYLQR